MKEFIKILEKFHEHYLVTIEYHGMIIVLQCHRHSIVQKAGQQFLVFSILCF